jgi:hypothetical protein
MANKKFTSRQILRLAGVGVALVGLSFLLAWFSNGYQSVIGWYNFLLTEVAALVIAWAGYVLLRQEEIPGWLIWLVLGAIVLRLAVGVFWVAALPVWGYPNEVQQAGYVMFDPFLRDNHAWELAQSGESLFSAFRGYSSHDQYGGLLFLSALLYRYIGGEVHRQLLVIVLTSTASGMAVLFTWGFIRRFWEDKAARLAAWGLALYPEAVLLGSSQMRGAFTIPLGAALAYLMLRYSQERKRKDLLLMALLTLLTAAITWAYLLQLIVVLGLLLVGLLIKDRRWKRLPTWLSIGLGILVSVVVLAGGYLWSTLTAMSNFQRHLTENASGVVQAVLGRLPDFLQIPFVVGYGVVRPLLPPAITESGASELWRWVAIWRAVGWTVLLTLLIYATLTVIRKRQFLKPAGMLMWGSWLMILVASFRAGGDIWDNPRYRVGFVVFQLALAVWSVVQHQTDRDPILRRVVVMVLALEGWIFVWYAARFYTVPWWVYRVENKIFYGLLTGGGYWLLDWLWVWSAKKRRVS